MEPPDTSNSDLQKDVEIASEKSQTLSGEEGQDEITGQFEDADGSTSMQPGAEGLQNNSNEEEESSTTTPDNVGHVYSLLWGNCE